ncbi:MAG TPA: PAS domain S-box protein [Candidatus Dormibacteraeota bacterium]|jgi:hypothetical protein
MNRRVPLRLYFVSLALVVVLAGAAAAAYVFIQSTSDAEHAAMADATFAANKAATQIDGGIQLIEATSASITGNPAALAQIIANPAGCQLGYAPLGAFDSGRIDIARPDGTVSCSSKPGVAGKTYGSASWLASASRQVLAPAPDPLDGHPVAIFTFPVPGVGLLAWFIDLTPLAPKLASEFATGTDRLEFLIASADGRAVVSRSIESARWTGHALAGTPFAASSGAGDRSDLDGTRRLYGTTTMASTGWKVYVGADRATALAAAGLLDQRQIAIIGAGVLLTWLAFLVVYRQVARPLSVSLEREGAGRESAERTYAQLFEGNPLPMTVSDVGTGRIIQANAAATEAFGYTTREFDTINRGDLLVPQDEAERKQVESIRTNPDVTFAKVGPISFRRKDGTIMRGDTTSYQVDLDGRQAWVALIEDVTEKEKTETQLAAAQRSYADLFEGNPLPSLILNPRSLQILEVNQAAVEALGYSRDEFRNLKTSQLIEPQDAAQAAQIQENRDSDAATLRFGPLTFRRKDGSFMRAVGTSYVVNYGDQQVRVALLEDVTEKEKIEQQMEQAQRLESLGQLAGGVAHDFNNLLTVILTVTSSLKASVADQESIRDIGRIDKAAKSASRLTHQLLAFARREVVTRSVLDVNDQVADLKDLLARTIGSHVVLTVDLAPDLWPVSMDRGQLEQIVINLAVNARDAMQKGGRLVIGTRNVTVDDTYATVHPGLAPGRYVEVRVADSGTGMDRATLEHAFEPFFTTKPIGKGTGMGLATVYGIVKQLEGNVAIYSEVGHGTTVTVLLPATSEAVTVESPTTPSMHLAASGRILVVEDYPDLRELFEEILVGAGYEVLVAPDGAAALALARRDAGVIDVLLTDVVMPNLLGPDLARELHAERPGMRVLFMSGHAQGMIGAGSPLPPGATMIQKPFMEAELLEKLAEVRSARATDLAPA